MQPSVNGCLRFLDQYDVLKARPIGSLKSQLASHFIKGRGQGHDHFLIAQEIVRMVAVPLTAHVFEVAPADFDGRKGCNIGIAMPREQVTRAIDAMMAQPTLGGADTAPGNLQGSLAG